MGKCPCSRYQPYLQHNNKQQPTPIRSAFIIYLFKKFPPSLRNAIRSIQGSLCGPTFLATFVLM